MALEARPVDRRNSMDDLGLHGIKGGIKVYKEIVEVPVMDGGGLQNAQTLSHQRVGACTSMGFWTPRSLGH